MKRPLRIINHAIQLDPQLAKAYYHRGVAQAALGKLEEAITDFDKTLKINPQHTGAINKRKLIQTIKANPNCYTSLM